MHDDEEPKPTCMYCNKPLKHQAQRMLGYCDNVCMRMDNEEHDRITFHKRIDQWGRS